MSRLPPKRRTPRRRTAPQEDADWWTYATLMLVSRSGGRCEHCDQPLIRGEEERHHRVRRRDGGDRLSNLLLLCRTSHRYITEHPAEAQANGWILRVGMDPQDNPVRIRGAWWLLDDYGLKHVLP